MGVFRKQGVFWIDYYADGHHKCERIGLDKRLAKTVHRKHKVESKRSPIGADYAAGRMH
jgi:hypothetical protein